MRNKKKMLLSVALSTALAFTCVPNAPVLVVKADSQSQTDVDAEVSLVDMPIYEQSLLNYIGDVTFDGDVSTIEVTKDVYDRIVTTEKNDKTIDNKYSFYTSNKEWAITLTAKNKVATLCSYCYKGPGTNMTYELPDTLTSYYITKKNIEYVEEDGKEKTPVYKIYVAKETDYITNIGTAFSGENNVSNSTNTALNLVLPKRVTTIENSAFEDNTKLVALSFKGGIQSIGNKAFKGCTRLQNLDLTALFDNVSNNTIPDYCFYQCNSLENITIPNTVLNIGEYAFYQCDKVESVIVPRRIKSIGKGAFSMCSTLRYLYIQNDYQDCSDIVEENEQNKLIINELDAPYTAVKGSTLHVGDYVYGQGTYSVVGDVDLNIDTVKITRNGEDVPFTEYISGINGYDVKAVSFKVSEKGVYKVLAEDELGNKMTVNFVYNADVQDDTAPVIQLKGTGKDGYYSNPVVYFEDNETAIATATLNGETIKNNYPITENGEYTLKVSDIAGNAVTKTFTVDNVIPEIDGITNNKVTGKDVTLKISDDVSGVDMITVNGEKKGITSEMTFTQSGSYNVKVADVAGNETEVSFVIDKEGPTVANISVDKYYNYPVIIKTKSISGITSINVEYKDPSGSAKEYAINDGDVLSEDGNYNVVVTDVLGSKREYSFVIDKIAPTFVNASDGKYYNVGQKIVVKDTNLDQVLVNKADAGDNFEITENTNTYKVEASDKAGNKMTSIISKNVKKDSFVGVRKNGIYTTPVKLTYKNKNTVVRFSVDGKKISIKKMKKGYKISKNGTHVAKMTVNIPTKKKKKTIMKKKVITTKFVIDNKAPVVEVQHNTENNVHTVNGIVSDNATSIDKVYLDNELLNANAFSCSEPGKHIVVAIDKAGNSMVYTFVI